MMLIKQAQAAKDASYRMMILDTITKNNALLAMADALEAHAEQIIAANALDLEAAEQKNKSQALLDRLRLTVPRIEGMANGLRKVAGLADPVGGEDYMSKLPNGLCIGKRRVPLGVVGIIFEARPNVTADAAALCLKSGNAVVLRGGKEAICSNIALVNVMRSAIASKGLPQDCVCLVEDTSRDSAKALMEATGLIDVLIPRGGKGLIRAVIEGAKVPVIETGAGVCHTYVDASADLEMALKIIENAKCSRPSVCNAMEQLLVDHSIAACFLPKLYDLLQSKAVQFRCCEKSFSILSAAGKTNIQKAIPEDFQTEYNDYVLGVYVTESASEAIARINKNGTRHSECIVTETLRTANLFCEQVDAAAVYVNASTRFTDGNEFGFGAEIGISTQKLHARGPMGLHELTTTKYVVTGNGTVR